MSRLGLAVLGGRFRLGRVVSGTLTAAGSLLTRFGVLNAGMVRARDRKYIVVPQRERLAAWQDGHASAVSR